MKISLINPPLSKQERYGAFKEFGANMPSLGILYLASIARKHGHQVQVIDAGAGGYSQDEIISKIRDFGPRLAGITAVTTSIVSAADLAGRLKAIDESIRIVLGGPHVTAVPEETMKRFADFDIGVIGEGEEIFAELINSDISDLGYRSIDGIIYRKGAEIIMNAQRRPIENLDSIPYPAWELLDGFPKSFRPALFKYKRLPAAHITSSRGCPSSCTFCDRSVFGRSLRLFSSGYILGQLEHLIKNFGIKEITFEDDTLMVNKKRLVDICEGILKRGLNISWSCNAKAVSADEEIFRLMKRAGCWNIAFGIESADEEILKSCKKGVALKQVERAVDLAHRAGIMTKGFFIIGFPRETADTIRRTIDFAKKIMLDDISVSFLTPFPGTEIFEECRQNGAIEDDWTKMNLMKITFVPHGLSEEKMRGLRDSFVKEFYLRPRIFASYGMRFFSSPNKFLPSVKTFYAFMKNAKN